MYSGHCFQYVYYNMLLIEYNNIIARFPYSNTYFYYYLLLLLSKHNIIYSCKNFPWFCNKLFFGGIEEQTSLVAFSCFSGMVSRPYHSKNSEF